MRYKLRCLLISWTVILIIIASISCNNVTDGEDTGVITRDGNKYRYENTEYGYTFYYPDNWTIDTLDAPQLIRVLPPSGHFCVSFLVDEISAKNPTVRNYARWYFVTVISNKHKNITDFKEESISGSSWQ